jgi:S-(hydroxymethyl)glutathione dehydrogenase/alcohol dehydrogenase
MKSLAAICCGVNEPWSVAEIDVDPPGRGEVLVEWAAAGLSTRRWPTRTKDAISAPC